MSAYVIIKVAAKLMLDRRIDSNGFFTTTDGRIDTHSSRESEAETQAGNRAAKTVGRFVNERSNQLAAPGSAAKDRTVASQFFDFMARAATEGIGPMAKLIIVDQISDLGESRDSFPQKKLAELIERVSREIFNETMRARFLDKMAQAVSALQTMRAF